jgi:acetyltransferase-like isoleucine patch superfamily enzyme
MNILNKLIQRLGKSGYVTDPSLSRMDVFVLLKEKAFQIIRGYYLKLFIKTDGLLFAGKRCRIKHKYRIKAGRTLTIGDNVEINALSLEGIKFGNNVSIQRNTIIECTGVIRSLGVGLEIGNNVGIAQNCFIQVRGKVIIGNDVIFGPGVYLFSENHNFENPDLPIVVQGETRKGVVIEEGVWIGAGATVLDGVRICRNSIVAAGSIVNQDVPAYSVVAGVPAKVVKQRK